jgi:dipeptidyl aminopeptidase/acylaminoacyl peptidase
MLKQLTKGNFEITDFYKFSSDGNFAFIQANKQSPIDFGIYKLDLSSGEMIGLNEEPGTHRAIVSDDGNNIIDNYQSVDIPNRYEFIDTNKKKREIILNAENPLSKFNMPKCEVKTIKAADDSTELYYRLITPSNLEEGKKYPAIIYVYGGPHAQLITNSWLAGAQGWLYYMAQQGYVMLTIDSRGSANRGMEFESVIHRNLGVIEIADQMEGVKLLKKLGYVDMDRIGVHGWSYGGFLTTTLMCDKDDIFKVGCAGGPVIDWKYYEIMYGERYMDTPDENPDGYSNSSLVNKADKLTGRLLIIHGAQDPVVVWQNSQAFLQACIKAGTIPDYFVYPTHEHNVRGYDRIHLMRMVTRYFNDHL